MAYIFFWNVVTIWYAHFFSIEPNVRVLRYMRCWSMRCAKAAHSSTLYRQPLKNCNIHFKTSSFFFKHDFFYQNICICHLDNIQTCSLSIFIYVTTKTWIRPCPQLYSVIALTPSSRLAQVSHFITNCCSNFGNVQERG